MSTYTGHILRVNLSSGTISKESVLKRYRGNSLVAVVLALVTCLKKCDLALSPYLRTTRLFSCPESWPERKPTVLDGG